MWPRLHKVLQTQNRNYIPPVIGSFFRAAVKNPAAAPDPARISRFRILTLSKSDLDRESMILAPEMGNGGNIPQKIGLKNLKIIFLYFINAFYHYFSLVSKNKNQQSILIREF